MYWNATVFVNVSCAVLQVIKLKRDWPKGYSRVGAAYSGLKQWHEAIEAYEQGNPPSEASQGLPASV